MKQEKKTIIDSLVDDVMNQPTFLESFNSLEEEKQKEVINSMYTVFAQVADTVLALQKAQIKVEATLELKVDINAPTVDLSKPAE